MSNKKQTKEEIAVEQEIIKRNIELWRAEKKKREENKIEREERKKERENRKNIYKARKFGVAYDAVERAFRDAENNNK